MTVPVGNNRSEIKLDQRGTIRLTAKAAVRLELKIVPMEAVVNAYPVAKNDITMDGSLQEISLDVPTVRNSWICLRF
jgi:hypothetical protein